MPSFINATEVWITGGIFAASALIVGWMAWLERRPRTSLEPRLVPTTPILMVFGFIGLLALVHLLNLYGIHTGRGTGP
jgi:uncharacterized iron-regulated membrane protein